MSTWVTIELASMFIGLVILIVGVVSFCAMLLYIASGNAEV